MISFPEFKKKQIIFVMCNEGDKISFSNDNIVIKDKDGMVKYQSTCYKIFMVIVVGNTTITSGLLERANRFGFSICLMNRSMKVYQVITTVGIGNTMLRKYQYQYDKPELGRKITKNKIENQRNALMKIRHKTDFDYEAIYAIDSYLNKLKDARSINEIMGIEGASARVYFPRIFSNTRWNMRRPRIKSDYVNATLDIGYNILFNFMDALLTSFGFDTYYGVLHRCFYRRKSLVCDLVEPFRPIIDMKVRKSINLGQIKEEDFQIMNHRYVLPWKLSPKYVKLFVEEIILYKDEIFLYVQQYYRSFMKQLDEEEFPEFEY